MLEINEWSHNIMKCFKTDGTSKGVSIIDVIQRTNVSTLELDTVKVTYSMCHL